MNNKNNNLIVDIYKRAIKKKTGARGLRSILEAILLQTMYELPNLEDVSEVIIDESVVKGRSEPKLVRSKNKKSTEKTSAA